MTSLSGALPYPAGKLVTTTLAAPTLSVSGLSPGPFSMAYSVPSGAPMPVGALHPASYPVVATSHSLSPAPHVPAVTRPSVHAAVPQVKLPKLSIKKFGGDLTKWVTFWDTFNSSIHSNPTLSSVDKFNYLMLLEESSAAEAIAGLTIMRPLLL